MLLPDPFSFRNARAGQSLRSLETNSAAQSPFRQGAEEAGAAADRSVSVQDRNHVHMTKTLHSEKSGRFDREILSYLLVWVVAFLMRAVYLWQVGHEPVFHLLVGDAVTYNEWAGRIAQGDWFGKGVFYQAPLYPYFLGALYTLFGRSLLAVRLVQIVVGASSCVLLAHAGRSFFNQTAGLLAGFFLAVYPTAIFFDCSIQKSVLDLFLVCALLAVTGKLLERSQHRWWLVTGLLLGLLALTRENALIFLPIVLAWLFVAWRGELWNTRLRWAGMVLIGLAAVLLPVGFRNLQAGGEFHLTTAQFGPNFYIGNSKAATGIYKPLKEGRGSAMFERDDATTLAEQATGRKLTPSEVSNYWTVKALNEIRADFSRWLGLACKKWLLVWNISEVGDTDDQYTYGDWSPLLQVLNRLLHFGTLCPLAVLGICLTWNRRKRVWLLYAMTLGYAGSVVLFYVFSRYRFSLVPMLILFAAAGLTSLADALREARRRALWAGVAAAVVAAAGCNHAMIPETLIRSETHLNLGDAFIVEGAVQDAIGQYEQSLQLNPDDVAARFNLATALVRANQFKEAVGHFEQALRIRPDDAHARYNLGVALSQLGQPGQAVEQFEQALRIEPDYAVAHYKLGSVLLEQGKIPEAISHWEQALRIEPNHADAHFKLGNVLAGQGKVSEAIGHWEQALRIEPNHAEVHYNWANALLMGGRLEEAIAHYNQALSIRPDYAEAHNNLGVALERAGRMQEAIEQYEQLVQLRPDLVEVQKRLALLRTKLPRQQGTR